MTDRLPRGHRRIPTLLLAFAHAGLFAAQFGCSSGASASWSLVKKAIRLRNPSVAQLSTEDLAAWLAKPDTTRPLLLDIRDPAEFEVSHLQDARLAPDLNSALAHLADAPPDTPIVAYCSVGYRSSDLAEQLQKDGFTRVYNLEGSIFQWVNEGRPIYREGEVVDEVHPYGGLWKQLLKPKSKSKKKR
ncbi:MAG: rhodanese-like domain-containing protein [Gemmatimonadetes bacterium]|jgi:rhodanese-related sulfurtransferase|nr:rhodanese-like domain-containing protein [Gemmatimonadota bacterium]